MRSSSLPRKDVSQGQGRRPVLELGGHGRGRRRRQQGPHVRRRRRERAADPRRPVPDARPAAPLGHEGGPGLVVLEQAPLGLLLPPQLLQLLGVLRLELVLLAEQVVLALVVSGREARRRPVRRGRRRPSGPCGVPQRGRGRGVGVRAAGVAVLLLVVHLGVEARARRTHGSGAVLVLKQVLVGAASAHVM